MCMTEKLLERISVLVLAVLLCGCATSRDDDASFPVTASGPDIVNVAIDDAVSRGVFPFLYVRVERLDGRVVYEYNAVNPTFTARVPSGESWMRLWSMSKSVTIATILSLEEDGLLARTDPVTDYLPEFGGLKVLASKSDSVACDTDLNDLNRAITIEDLLNHNDGFYYPFTGIPCLDEAMNRARLPEATSTQELIDRIAALPLHPDGIGEHHYGIGTTVLGLVAERATGQRFDDIVQARITGPLGIADSLRYTLPANSPTYPRVTGADGTLRFATDTDLDIFGGPVPQYGPDTAVFLGGEGMVGTTAGFAVFLRMMGHHGALNGTRILREDTVRDWYAPKTQLDSSYGHNGFNIWVTSGKFDGLPNQKPGLLVGGGYEGTAFWIDLEAGYVGLIMSQVHHPATGGIDEVSRLRGMLYEHVLEPGGVQ